MFNTNKSIMMYIHEVDGEVLLDKKITKDLYRKIKKLYDNRKKDRNNIIKKD